jgi:MoaA/NifB/PqqE/SkfB family radical SAM enzyme
VSTEEAKRIVDKAYEFGASFFGITGGEALLRKDLFEVVGYAKKIGAQRRLKLKWKNEIIPELTNA